jgi:hypothetical protein
MYAAITFLPHETDPASRVTAIETIIKAKGITAREERSHMGLGDSAIGRYEIIKRRRRNMIRTLSGLSASFPLILLQTIKAADGSTGSQTRGFAKAIVPQCQRV